MFEQYERVLNDIWQNQKPAYDAVVGKEELDLHLKEYRGQINDLMKNKKMLGLQNFKNVYVLEDAVYGGVCDICGGSHVVIHTENPITSVSEDVVWLPSVELAHFLEVYESVFPMDCEMVKKKEVSYKCLHCKDSKWKYMIYDNVFGLTYGQEEVKCIANAENVECVGYELLNPFILESKYPKNSQIILSDTRENIESLNMDYIYSWVDSLMKVEKAKTYSIIMHLSGYDTDPRDLWEISEVKTYVRKLLTEKPELLWFLQQKEMLIMCYASEESDQMNNGLSRVAMNSEKVSELATRVLRKIKASSFFTPEDVKSYMRDFNAAMGRDIYYI